jgi:hypothetical protein
MKLQSVLLLLTLCIAVPCRLSAAERKAARPPRPIPQELKIHAVAHAFRLVAATDFASALRPIQTGECMAPLVNHPLARDLPAVWGYFFCGASLWLGNAGGTRPIVGYYNPYLDALLLAQWAAHGRAYAITAADVVIGTEWAGVLSDGDPAVPWWIANRGKQSCGAVLASQYRKVAAAFSQRYPLADGGLTLTPSARLAASVEMVLRRAASGLQGVLSVQSPDRPAFNPALGALTRALRQQNPVTLHGLLPAANPLPAGEIIQLPADVRQRLAPAFSLMSPEASLVFLTDPKFPTFVLIAGLRQPPDAKVEALGFYDLATVPAATARK